MKVFGLFGEKLSHSLSPTIHNMIYQALGVDAAYSLYEIPPHLLESAVKGIKALNIHGVNVTIPYKVHIMDYLDSVSPEANKIGAVNTIYHHDGLLHGYNTDYIGFGRLLERSCIDVAHKSTVVLGTGGAAKATTAFLEDHGAKNISIVSRDPNSITSFGGSRCSLLGYNQLEQLEHADLLINCTPCGMYPKTECTPVDEDIISRFDAVVDLIYNPNETLLLKLAAQKGKTAINGLYMLVEQAVAAAEIWLGYTIESTIADDIYLNLLKR